MSSILVLDPDAEARQRTASALWQADHEVRELEPTCLFEVLQALHQACPDLLIMEAGMFGCPASPLIQACRADAHLKQMRILLLSAKAGLDLARFLHDVGNAHYLAKPVSAAELAECVQCLLQSTGEPGAAWMPLSHGTVAVVDDSPLSRAFHANCLRRSGFLPVQIPPADLLSTVLALEEVRPRLVVVDFLMPQFRGDVLIRALRGRQPLKEVPVLVVTAHRAGELATLLRPIGGVEILFKPVSDQDLAQRARSILGLVS